MAAGRVRGRDVPLLCRKYRSQRFLFCFGWCVIYLRSMYRVMFINLRADRDC